MTSVPASGLPGTNHERTFIAIKPDGVQRNKVGDIIARFENKGYKLVAMKMCTPTKEKAEGHYADLAKKPFFPGLVKYFSSGPIVAMCWEGQNAIAQGRVLLGATNPKDSLPGTIRGDLCIDVGRNICHGSDGPDSAAHEINYWFTEEELQVYTSHSHSWVYEKGAAVKKGAAKQEKKAKKDKKKDDKKKDAKKEDKKEADAKAEAKAVKACLKEGGKKGQDLCGMAAFGCHFFLTNMEEPKGNMEKLRLCMQGANKEIDPDADDRKGGAGDLGKIFFTAGDSELSMYAHVPKEAVDKATLDQFFSAVLAPAKVEMVKEDEFFATAHVKGNPDAGVFPLKLRDECIAAGFDFLRSKGLILDDESDDENYLNAEGVDVSGKAGEDY